MYRQLNDMNHREGKCQNLTISVWIALIEKREIIQNFKNNQRVQGPNNKIIKVGGLNISFTSWTLLSIQSQLSNNIINLIYKTNLYLIGNHQE